MLCNSCPRRCNAERNNEKGSGYCGMPLLPVIAKVGLHLWEEPVISGSSGSGTVFFSGCSMGCVYCQNYEISHNKKGIIVTPARLAEIFKELENKGAHNINFVNPTHFIWAIKEALEIYRPNIPLVYNSSGYDDAQVIAENIFDVYLMDLKYVSSEKSLKYSGAADYFEIASRAVKAAYNTVGATVVENGIMKRGIIVRHLLLPFGTKEAIKVIDWVKENVPNAYFSLMAQYIPVGKAENYTEINRKITKREYEKVLDYLIDAGLKNVFAQEISSAAEEYVPDFDFSGVLSQKY